MTATTRREMLRQTGLAASAAGLSAGVVALPAMASTADPLIALGVEYDRAKAIAAPAIERYMTTSFYDPNWRVIEAEFQRLGRRQDDLAEQIASMVPTSREGALVQVRVGREWSEGAKAGDSAPTLANCFEGIATWIEGLA